MVSCGSEVDEVSKSSSHSFCELDDTVDGFDGSGSQPDIEVGEDAIQILTNGLGQMAEGAEATARGPTTPPPEFSFGKLAVGVCASADECHIGRSQRGSRLLRQRLRRKHTVAFGRCHHSGRASQPALVQLQLYE